MSATAISVEMGGGLPRVEPEGVGLSSERLERIRPVMEGRIERRQIPGAVAVVARRGRVAYCQAFGAMDAEEGRAMPVDAIFRIASMTKPLTTVALLSLFEEGRLRLDDPIAGVIPEFGDARVVAWDTRGSGPSSGSRVPTVPAARPITFRHLVTHTAGLPGPRTPLGLAGPYFDALRGMPELARRVLPEAPSGERRSLLETVRALARVPLSFQPGTAWEYGLGHDVAGVLVELISGQTLEDFMRARIFEPLGMVDTSFTVAEPKLERLVTAYDARLAESRSGGAGWTIVSRGRALEDGTVRAPRDFRGGGGLTSTLPDYVRFAQMLLNGGALDGVRVLGRKTVEMMTSNQTGDLYIPIAGPGYGYGLGVRVCTDPSKADVFASPATFGWGGALASHFFVDPGEELIGVYSTQVAGAGAGMLLSGLLGTELQRLVYQAIVD